MVHMILAAALATSGALPAFATETHRFNVPIEEPVDAVRDFAAQAHVQILVDGENVKDKHLHPVLGEYSTDKGLSVLLADSGLKPQYVGDHSIALVTLAQAENAASQVTDGAKEGKKSDSSRVASVDQGTTSSTISVDSSPSPATGNGQGERNNTISEVIVTAQKKGDERLIDVPVPVAVVSGQTLLNYNHLRIEDFYDTVPGFTYSTTGSQSQSTLSLRGISNIAGANPTVGIMIDDVPFGSPVANENGNVVPDVDPNDLARVEILRGPQGTLYGASSMGGLIKFVTQDPSVGGFNGNISAGVSSVNNGAEGYSFRASANIPLSDTLAIRASGFTRQDPGYIDNPFLNIKEINKERASGGRIAALWTPNDWLSLRISGLYQDIKADGSFDVNSGPGYANGLGDLQQNYAPGVGGYDRTVAAYSAALTAKLESVTLTSITGYSQNNFTDSWDFTYAFSSFTQKYFLATVPFGYTPVTDRWNSHKISEELRLSGSIAHNIDWLVGGYFEHEGFLDFENIYAADQTGAYVGQWANWTFPEAYREVAGFADLTYHFTDRFDVQIGGRESHSTVINDQASQLGLFATVRGFNPITPANDVTANVFTYLVTPQFKISPEFMVYGRVATGWRPGVSSGAPALIPPGISPHSNPDKTTNYEIGLKGDFLDHRLVVDTSIYYIDWPNIQTTAQDKDTGFNFKTNVGNAKSEGLELSVMLRPLTGLTISGWVDYDDAVITQSFPDTSFAYSPPGATLPFSARWSGHASVEQSFPLTDGIAGFIGGEISYIGDRKGQFAATATDYRQDLPAYTRVNLRAGLKSHVWAANLYCTNVANKRGLIGGGAGNFPPQGFQYITPRTVGLDLARSF